MNQDNQVKWNEAEFDANTSHLSNCDLDFIKSFISRVAQDSYAEGIRRARERVLSIELYNSDEIDRHAVVKAFDDLEEEVKK